MIKIRKPELLTAIRVLIKIYEDDKLKDDAILSVMRQLLNIYHDSPTPSDYTLLQSNAEYND